MSSNPASLFFIVISKLALFFVDTYPKIAHFSENIDDIRGDAVNKKDGQIIE